MRLDYTTILYVRKVYHIGQMGECLDREHQFATGLIIYDRPHV